jgi:hypothetical protein
MLWRFILLARPSRSGSGLIPGLCDAFQRLGHLAVEHMRVARGGLDVRMIEGALDKFQADQP